MNTMEKEKLIITLHNRINSETASDVEDYIFQEIKKKPAQEIILDVEDVPYISSAGLRSFLKVKKIYDNLKVINASSAVYDVFAVTGFTDLMDVKKALRKISVDGCEILGQGGHGTVYRLDADTIIKVYGEKESLEEIQREIDYARTAFVYGIPTAIAFDVVRCQNHYGAVFELIKADTLGNAITREPEKFDMYKQKYIELIDTLHTQPVDISKFKNIKDLYHQWVDDTETIYTESERNVLHKIINSVPDKKTLVHGDIHTKNVMVQDGQLVLIDMADITYGHPIFDFAGMGLTHWIMVRRTPERAIPMLGLSAKQVGALWDAVLNHTFGNLPESEQKKNRKLIEGFTMMKYTLAPAVNKSIPDVMKEALAKSARTDFFPMAESLIGAIRE